MRIYQSMQPQSGHHSPPLLEVASLLAAAQALGHTIFSECFNRAFYMSLLEHPTER